MNIIVTGASRGIGLSLVKEFLRNSQNRIYAISRNTDKFEPLFNEKHNGTLVPILFDLKTFISENGKISFLEKETKIDILINNAGFLINKPFDLYRIDEIEEIFKVNVTVPSLLIKNVLPFFNKKSAHIVNIGSMGGFQGSEKFPGLSFYSASKGALAILTECLAAEYKNTQLRFNCLALGSVQTEMLQEAFPGYKALLTPEDMAKFIVDFAVNGYRYFNGKTIPVSFTGL